MPYLSPEQYPLAAPFFRAFDAYHPSVQAALAGTGGGQVWVDSAEQPRVAFVSGPEGCYLGGDPRCESAYAELREVIPLFAYLLVDPPGWEAVLGRVWKNIAARRHYRKHYLFRRTAPLPWRDQLPEGIRVVPVDEDFFGMDSLENHDDVMNWLDGWPSREAFLEHGAGTCLVSGGAIASWSLMDFYVGDRCEIGVNTDKRFRRRGLGSLVVSATLEACLARGYREVGWQCLANNAGSIGVALRTGFEFEREYLAFSCWIPAESAGDMSPAECEEWALHYERASQQELLWAFEAAQAWGMVGKVDSALACLRRLRAGGWKARPEWFENNFRLDALRAHPDFDSLRIALLE